MKNLKLLIIVLSVFLIGLIIARECLISRDTLGVKGQLYRDFKKGIQNEK